LSLIFFLNGKIDSAISFRILWTIFWLAKTSNKPISLTIWLAVNPYLVILAGKEPISLTTWLAVDPNFDVEHEADTLMGSARQAGNVMKHLESRAGGAPAMES